MIKLDKARVACFDVDDTLILWEPEKYTHLKDQLIHFEDSYGKWELLPHFRHIEFMKNLKHQGYGIVMWSAAGGDWAEKIANKLELQDVVDICMSKPEFAIDDLPNANQIIKTILYINPETGEFRRT